jgi:hypothetical protein
VTFVAESGTDGIRSFRALLKVALRRFGLRAIDVRQYAPDARTDERARAQPGRQTMSAFSDRVRSQKKGMFKVVDFDDGKELTLTISHLDEEMEMFGEKKDLLNFKETGQQLQLNQTTSEWLLDNLGDDPANWEDKQVTLHLAEYTYENQKKLGIRLRLPGTPTPRLATLGDGQTQVRPVVDRKTDLDDEIPF